MWPRLLKLRRALEFVLVAYCRNIALYIPVITNRFSDGLVSMLHSAEWDYPQVFTGTSMCFEKVGVALCKSNAHTRTTAFLCEVNILQG